MDGQQGTHGVTPRRLSFNLEDFQQPVNNGAQRDNRIPFTAEENSPETPRTELNLIGGFNLEQLQNLATLVSNLSARMTTERGAEKHPGNTKGANDDAPVTQKELRRFLQNKHNPPNAVFDLEPPLTSTIMTTPYPSGYQPPTFRKFDGTGSAKEHIMSFLDDLGIHRNDKDLRPKEFSKSLSGRAFTRYTKLRPYSINTWEELVTEFCGKFLEEEGALHIMDLGRVKQKNGESLIAFIKHYRDRALQCKETLPEADLVYGCIKNIEDGSQIFLSLSGISTFAELMRKVADVADVLKRQGKRTKETEGVFDICVAEEKEKKKAFRNGRTSGGETSCNNNELPPIPLATPQICQLVEEWIKDGTLRPRSDKPPLTKEQYDDPMYCILHRVLLPEAERGGYLYKRPSTNHSVSTINSSAGRLRIEEVEEEVDIEEGVLAVGLSKTRGFRVLLGKLGMGHDAQKEAAKVVIRIVRKLGGDLSVINAPLTRLARSHSTTIIFREPTDLSPQFCHNHPLYVEATIEGIKVRRALVDNGSGVNIIPTYMFQKLNLPSNRLWKSHMRLSTFHGEVVETLGCIYAVLEVGPIKTTNVFQIVEGDSGYHLLLGRPWIHLHQCVPSTLHQCIKSNFKGKDIEITGVRASFEATKAHLIDASLFDEVAPPGRGAVETRNEVSLQRESEFIKRNGVYHPTQALKRPKVGRAT
ncbi:Retrotransposon gag domain [Sesbania bispinosa]|nr:Retrotransposon gag domain [Sesbania bispinosa]